jgi:hypothetical protein
MVTAAVFSTSNQTNSAFKLHPAEELSEAIGRWPTPDWESLPVLPDPSVAAAATQLMKIVIGLRSLQGGWPDDLPQTAANLVPYVGEETTELVDVLQSSAGIPSPLPTEELSPDRFLLSALIPRLLWGIASSGYEMMRLLEGIQARFYETDGTFTSEVVRLLPLLSFRRESMARESTAVVLDLVTQMAPQEALLTPQMQIQLIDSDIDSGPTTVANLLEAMTQRLRAEVSDWQAFLTEGWKIDLLFPHSQWQSGYLTLKLALAKVAGDFDLQDAASDWSIQGIPFREDSISLAAKGQSAIAEANAPVSKPPTSRTDEIEGELLPHINGLAGRGNQENSATFTLDDFAETVEQTKANTTHQRISKRVSGTEVELEAFSLSQLQLPEASVSPPLTASPSSSTATLGATWLTFTDEVWVQQFLLTVAQQAFLRRLSSRIDCPKTPRTKEALALVTAAFEVSDQIQGGHGMFKYTFVHQPILGADLWPRLRWHLARTSELLMQLMGGLPVRYLGPRQAWQTGLLFWQPTATIAVADQTWKVDLTTGHNLSDFPRQIAAETVICPLVTHLLSGPLSLTKINHHIEAELKQQVPALAALKSATPVDIHTLEANPGSWSGHLTLDWGFTILHSAY